MKYIQVIKRKSAETALLLYRCWETSDASKSTQAQEVVVEALIMALNNSDDNLCWRVARDLGKIGDPRAVESLIVSFQSAGKRRDSNYVRWHCVFALGMIGDIRATGILEEALQNPETEEYSRGWIVQALGRILEPQEKQRRKQWTLNE